MYRPGTADRFFYYTSSYDSSAELQMETELASEIDKERLALALNKALGYYPEFKVRMGVKDNTIFYEENTEEVIIRDLDDETVRHFGTDETGGYLFVPYVRGREFMLSLFHGLTDIYGIWSYMKTAFYFYYSSFNDDEKAMKEAKLPRCKKLSLDDVSGKELRDPYDYYGNAQVKREHVFNTGDSFRVRDKRFSHDIRQLRSFLITMDAEQVHRSAKERGSSFAPLFAAVFSEAFDRERKEGDEKVVGMMPTDMRKYYGSDTMNNFSDALYFPWEGYPDLEKGISEYTNMMALQNKREQFDEFLKNKADFVKEIEASGEDIETVCRNMGSLPFEDGPSDFSYGLTYPGRLETDAEYGQLIKSVRLNAFTSIKYSGGVVSCKGRLMLIINQWFEDESIAKRIFENIRSLGIDARWEEPERCIRRNIMDIGKVKR